MLDAPNTSSMLGKRDVAFLHNTLLYWVPAHGGHQFAENYYEDDGYWVLDFTVKRGKQNRLAIHQELQNAIRQYLAKAEHEKDRDAFIHICVLRPAPRTSLSGVQAWKIFQKYADKVGLPTGVTPHSTRATFIT